MRHTKLIGSALVMKTRLQTDCQRNFAQPPGQCEWSHRERESTEGLVRRKPP